MPEVARHCHKSVAHEENDLDQTPGVMTLLPCISKRNQKAWKVSHSEVFFPDEIEDEESPQTNEDRVHEKLPFDGIADLAALSEFC